MTQPPLALGEGCPGSLVLVGAGKMGGAMLEGWLAHGLAPAATTVLDPHPSPELTELCGTRGLALNPPAGPPGRPEVLVLGIKPQALGDVAPAIAHLAGPDTLVLSILAGKTAADIRRALPGADAIVRAMPNLPASIGRGATGAYASSAVTAEGRALADALLRANGTVEWLDREHLIDAVTGLSGSGPAYVFHLVEALTEAGSAAGLEPGLAGRLARQTVVGAAALLEASDLAPARLRENVTSKGGTTAAGLAVLTGPGGLGPLMIAAVAAAKRRATELAG